eukprot:403364047
MDKQKQTKKRNLTQFTAQAKEPQNKLKDYNKAKNQTQSPLRNSTQKQELNQDMAKISSAGSIQAQQQQQLYVNPNNLMNGSSSHVNGRDSFQSVQSPVSIGGGYQGSTSLQNNLDQMFNQQNINTDSRPSSQGVGSQHQGSSQSQYDSLLSLFCENYCSCGNQICKAELTTKFQQFMKTNFNKTVVSDLINILSGTQSTGKLVNIIIFLLKSLELHSYSQDVMDNFIDLFVMLYLKSNQVLKRAIVSDLETCFFMIKDRETTLFVDKKFSYKIFFYNLNQFRFCQKLYEEDALKNPAVQQPLCEHLDIHIVEKRVQNQRKQQLNYLAGQSEKSITTVPCQTHGSHNVQSNTIDLSKSQQKFISYVCLLSQLYFKILKIEDTNEKIKESRRKMVCNLLYSLIEHCNSKYYYFPLRALSELFSESESEIALSKRLNSESLLYYNLQKKVQGRDLIVVDFKMFSQDKKIKDFNQKVMGSGYSLLYADTLSEIRKILSRLEQNQNLDSYILCLKIISFIMNEKQANDFQQDAVTLYIDCLVAISQNLTMLKQHEKECYYMEVKNLISIIKQRQIEYEQSISLQQQEELNQNEVNDYLSDNEGKQNGQAYLIRNAQGRFVTQKPQTSSKSFMRNQKHAQKFPNISILQHLLTVQAIQQYPKLALLAFDVLQPYIQIFNNPIISFMQLSIDYKLIIDKFTDDIQGLAESLRKKIKLSNSGSYGREIIQKIFLKDYSKNMQRIAETNQQSLAQILPGTQLTTAEYIQQLRRQKQNLNREEIIFIIDFLLQICKHAQVFDDIAISLGTHLFSDMYQKSDKRMDLIIKEQAENTELLFVNFDMRFKLDVSDIVNYKKQVQLAQQKNVFANIQFPDDPIFALIFSTVFNQIISVKDKGIISLDTSIPRGKYEEYTSHFIRLIIKLLQTSKEHIKTEMVKNIVEKLIFSEKIEVSTNSWPLYIVSSMFLNTQMINQDTEGIVRYLFDHIQHQVLHMKDNFKEFKEPMLHFFRLRNLINTYTSILRYLLCFPTPQNEKSSSQYYNSSSNLTSQQQNPQHQHSAQKTQTQNQASQSASQNTFTSGYPGNNGSQVTHNNLSMVNNQSSIVQVNSELYENQFIIKRQKRCNFCGEQLSYPKKFTYERKCKSCSCKNSTLVFPARFLCNMCVQQGELDLFQCTSDQIPLDNLKNADQLSTMRFMSLIQEMITKAFQLVLNNIESPANQEFYFSKTVPCLKKIEKIDNLLQQLITHILNRLLKVMHQMLCHDIEISEEMEECFNKIAKRKDDLTDSFKLTKNRIESNIQQIKRLKLRLKRSSNFK